MSLEYPPSYQRILQSARDEIFAKGIIGLRVSAVAKSAKTSIPLIYKYFVDREGLLTEVLGQIYLEFLTEDIDNAKKWLVKNNGKALKGPEIAALFPGPFDKRFRDRRIWIARIVVAALEMDQLHIRLNEVHSQLDREFDAVIVEIHSLIREREHFSPKVMRAVFRGISFGQIFSEFNYGQKVKKKEWQAFLSFLLAVT